MTASLTDPQSSGPTDVQRTQRESPSSNRVASEPLRVTSTLRPVPMDHETVALQSSQLLRVRAAEFYRAHGLGEQPAQAHGANPMPGFTRLFKSGSMSHLNNNASTTPSSSTSSNNNNNSSKHSNANSTTSGGPTATAGSFGNPDFRASYGMGHHQRRAMGTVSNNPHYHTQHPPPERPQRTHSERQPGSKTMAPFLERKQRQTNGHHHHQNAGAPASRGLHRSNSSLDLEQHLATTGNRRVSPETSSEKNVNLSLEDYVQGATPNAVTAARRRDYGSASSLDVLGTTGDSFFALLREYRHGAGTGGPPEKRSVAIPLDQRSAGPAKIQEFLRGKLTGRDAPSALSSISPVEGFAYPQPNGKKRTMKSAKSEDWTNKEESTALANCTNSAPVDVVQLEDKLRKKLFAHYDCQSLTANLTMASRLRNVLAKRRNTTTGASAASQVAGDNPEGDVDTGDGRFNDLVQSCPFFRNELGGEEERQLALNKMTAMKNRQLSNDKTAAQLPATLGAKQTSSTEVMIHKPMSACGLSVLESSGGAAKWKFRPCPYEVPSSIIEGVDHGATFFRTFFKGEDHQNWLGIDESLGPVAISIKKERVSSTPLHTDIIGNGRSDINHHHHHNSYRLIVRTSGLNDLRGTILEDSIPGLWSSSSSSSSSAASSSRKSREGITLAKEVIEFIAPEIQLPCLRLATPAAEAQLLKLDEQKLTNTYKVGVLYCRAGQSTEEDMYNNETAGKALDEFLDTIGRQICLKDFGGYKGGLDCKTDTTGTHSVYNTFEDCEVMFHVSTLLPYTPANRQQILRKRHIGNDIVTIVFQEPGSLPFTPKNIRSRFQHVFIVVRAIEPCTGHTRYSVAISRSRDITPFGPPLPEGAVFNRDKKFTNWLLAKIINAENAAHRSHKFATMAQRTRQECIRDLATNSVTQTTLTENSNGRFSLLNSFGGRSSKKDKTSQNIIQMMNSGCFVPDRCVREAISWQVQVEDYGQGGGLMIDAYLAISAESIAIVDHTTGQVLFGAPTSTVLGFSSQAPHSVRIFYHQGESLLILSRTRESSLAPNVPDFDEIKEICSRLEDVSGARETVQVVIERNTHGQLGFHVNNEGIVQEVEKNGNAFASGLRPGARLVEACHIAVATLSYDQLVEVLKTSTVVAVTIVLPYTQRDGNQYNIARRGCGQHSCSYLEQTPVDYETNKVPAPFQPRSVSENAFTGAMRYQQTPPPLPLRSNSATLAAAPKTDGVQQSVSAGLLDIPGVERKHSTTYSSSSLLTTMTMNQTGQPIRMSSSAQQIWPSDSDKRGSPLERRTTLATVNPLYGSQITTCGLLDDERGSPCSSVGASSGASSRCVNIVTVQASPAKVHLHANSISPIGVNDASSSASNSNCNTLDKEWRGARDSFESKDILDDRDIMLRSRSPSALTPQHLGRVSQASSCAPSLQSAQSGSRGSGMAVEDYQDLAMKVAELQSNLAQEQSQKANLERQMRQLQEENDKLKKMTQETQSQLKKIASWFQSGQQPQQ